MYNYLEFLKHGSKIHIKESHKGKFTEYCDGKVTEECIRKGKNSPSAKIRKQATFAANARKWQTGGSIFFNSMDNLNRPGISIADPRLNISIEQQQELLQQELLQSNWIDDISGLLTDRQLSASTQQDQLNPQLQTTSDQTGTTDYSQYGTYTPTGKKKIQYSQFYSHRGGNAYGKLEQHMKDFISLLEEEGVPIRISSGWRPAGSAGKAGNRSHHVHGGAIDITPLNGNYDELREIFTQNPRIRGYMQAHNLGIIDETTPEVMRKTGASGKHFHIGPDRMAKTGYSNMIANFEQSHANELASIRQKYGYQNNSTILNTQVLQPAQTRAPSGQLMLTIDGKSHKAVLVDSTGKQLFSAGVAVGKNGTGLKRKTGDSVTPIGDFSIMEIKNASSWSHDFRDGKGNIKGAYGPYFMRLSYTDLKGGHSIGLHGTHDPRSIGTNASEGCIRFNNNDLLNLYSIIQQYGGHKNIKVKITADGGTIDAFLSGGKAFFNARYDETRPNVEIIDPSEKTQILTQKSVDLQLQQQSSDWVSNLLSSFDQPALQSDTEQTSDQTQLLSTQLQQETLTTQPENTGSHSGTSSEFRDKLYKGLSDLGFGGETGKALVAQMGLETGHGKHMAGNYNYANITAGSKWTGKTKTKKDNHNGRMYTFRSYDTLDQGLSDYLRLIQVYDIKPGDTKDQVFSKLNGNNHGKRYWAEAKHYVEAMNKTYKYYWG